MSTSEKARIRVICPSGSTLAAAIPLLQQSGFAVHHCESFYRAILAQRSDPCALVLLDGNSVKPEDQDFFAILREITPEVFILAVLSDRLRGMVPGLLRIGVDAYLTEPYYPDELLSVLRKAVERSAVYIRRDQQFGDRLRGLAQLASGVAHEINNPLSVIYGWLQVLMADTPADNPQRSTLAMLQKETARIEKIVRDLLAFSGQASPNRTALNVNQVLEEVLASEGGTATGGLSLVKNLAPELPPVLANELQLKEACRHLVERARRSSPAGGEVLVATGSPQGDVVEIRFHDSGPAIPRDAQEKLFDPFCAIDQRNGADGLGLCVSYGIVRGLGGQLAVQSEDGKGTTFTVTLPAANGAGARNGNGKRNAYGN